MKYLMEVSMTKGTTDVYCVYCDNRNEIDLQDYAGYDWTNLATRCDTCGSVFGFDVSFEIEAFKLTSTEDEDVAGFFE